MATKSYSKHKEYKEFSSSSKGTPYTDEQFDMLKTELIPKGSKLESITRNGNSGAGAREYHYEYKEEKHPSGKYDRKDLHTVEEYTIPPKKVTSPKSKESSSYYYEREEREIPAVTGTRTYNYESSSSLTPGYTKVKSSKVTKDLSHNVDELDSLLDDLQKDQERQLYKSGYTSDTAESSSFDYRRGTPAKAPSSGYSTLKREERSESQWSAPAPVVKQEVRQELFREETHESRVVPSPAPLVSPAPAAVCSQCHHHTNTSTLSRSSTPMNKVTTTVKTYTYEVPAGADPAAVPLPVLADSQRTYVTSSENVRSASNTLAPVQSPSLGCQFCSHCNSRVSATNLTNNTVNVNEYRHTSTSDREHTNERIIYPVNDNKHLSPQPLNGQPNYGPQQSYKITESSFSHSSVREPSPPARFPRSPTPSSPAGTQQPPKKLDDLLADFPEARFPTQPDGVTRRRIEVSESTKTADQQRSLPTAGSKNSAGPAVYYPPGHVPFQNKPESAAYQASAMQGGGAYGSGRGMYEYESGAKSKEKHSEKKTAVPVCLPLCCAMPCVIM